MTYQQAGRMAIIKRLAGWLLFIPALLSSLISLMRFLEKKQEQREGINAVMQDFSHVMIDMIRFNTHFLHFFWQQSPLPDFSHSGNILFWFIYYLIFVGLALQASGTKMAQQSRRIRQGLDDHMILEKAKGAEGRSRQQLEENLEMPRHTVFLQIFTLYILPVVIVIAGYFILKLFGYL